MDVSLYHRYTLTSLLKEGETERGPRLPGCHKQPLHQKPVSEPPEHEPISLFYWNLFLHLLTSFLVVFHF